MQMSSALLAGLLALAITAPALAADRPGCALDTQACLDQMAAKLEKRGYMGLEFDKGADGQYVIRHVVEGTPAARAGFKPGDVILVVNGARWNDEDAMRKLDWSIGSRLAVKVLRGSDKMVMNVTLTRMPPDVVARYIGAHMLESHVTIATATIQPRRP